MKQENIEITLKSTPLEYYDFPDHGTIIPDAPTFYNTKSFKLIQDVGCVAFVENAEYPMYVLPSADSLYAINLVKEYFKIMTMFIFVATPNKIASNFARFSNKALYGFKVKKEYVCPTTRGVYKFVKSFLLKINIQEHIAEDFARNFSHIIEYDDAYKLRLQDIASEADIIKLYSNPRKEIKRLIKILGERQGYDNRGVTEKIMMITTPLLWLLFIPKIKNAFLSSIHHVLDMKYSKADLYWVSFKGGYKFLGVSQEERQSKVSKVPYMYTYA